MSGATADLETEATHRQPLGLVAAELRPRSRAEFAALDPGCWYPGSGAAVAL